MAKKLLIEDNQDLPSAYYQEDAKTGYTDRTSDPIYWDLYGWEVLDYWHVVMKIQNDTVDWSTIGGLTAPQKAIGAKYMLLTYAERVAGGLVTEAEDVQNAHDLLVGSYAIDSHAIEGRLELAVATRECIYIDYARTDKISLANSKAFGKDVSLLLMEFERFSGEDYSDWLNDTGSYSSTGISSTTYFGSYKSEITTKLIDIYNGD